MKKDIDTVVSPAKYEDKIRNFFKEKIWSDIHIAKEKKDRLKYFALYKVLPLGQIIYVGEILDIPVSNANDKKYNILVKDIDVKIKPKERGDNFSLRRSRYTTYERLISAKTLSDLFD